MLNKKLLYSGGLPLDHPNLLLHGYTLSLSSGKLQVRDHNHRRVHYEI